MGQRVDARGFRLAHDKNWDSVWYDEKRFRKLLHEDLEIRQFLRKQLRSAGIERVKIERSLKEVRIKIFVAKPGLVIGRGGARIENLKKCLQSIVDSKLYLDVEEVKEPNLSAEILAAGIASQIERHFPYKRAVAKTIEKAKEAGARGIRVVVAGVLSGATSIARTEKKGFGPVPSQTLKKKVDFAKATAFTRYGTIGVKVWVYKGDE